MLPMVSNVYNLHLWNQTDYVKENIDWSMSFTQVGNYLNKGSLSFLQNKVMENYEDTIDYSSVISYEFPQYSLKQGMNKLGSKGETVIMEDLSQIHMKSAEHLTE